MKRIKCIPNQSNCVPSNNFDSGTQSNYERWMAIAERNKRIPLWLHGEEYHVDQVG